MKHPKCRLCGHEHPLGTPHRLVVGEGADLPTGKVSGVGAEAVVKERGEKGSFDRVEYQRAYMRDRRAARKLGLTVAEYRARHGASA